MHQQFKEVPKKIVDTETIGFPAKGEQVQGFDRISALRESLLSIWRVDVNQAVATLRGPTGRGGRIRSDLRVVWQSGRPIAKPNFGVKRVRLFFLRWVGLSHCPF